MAIDEKLLKNFQSQVEILEKLKQAAQDAIDRANRRLEELNRGEPIEKVFGNPPKK